MKHPWNSTYRYQKWCFGKCISGFKGKFWVVFSWISTDVPVVICQYWQRIMKVDPRGSRSLKWIPSRYFHISHLGKLGKSSTQICQKSGGYVNSLEGSLFNDYVPTINQIWPSKACRFSFFQRMAFGRMGIHLMKSWSSHRATKFLGQTLWVMMAVLV